METCLTKTKELTCMHGNQRDVRFLWVKVYVAYVCFKLGMLNIKSLNSNILHINPIIRILNPKKGTYFRFLIHRTESYVSIAIISELHCYAFLTTRASKTHYPSISLCKATSQFYKRTLLSKAHNVCA